MSALASGLGVLRFQLRIGHVQAMLVIALAAAASCSPALVHGDGRDALPLLADLVFACFIIAAPLLVHGAEPCLRGLPVSPARLRLSGYLAMLLISWLGMLAGLLQIPFATEALRGKGWPTFESCLGEACEAPFWLMVMVPIAAVLRHRLRVLALLAVAVAVLVLPDQSRTVVAVRSTLMIPAHLLGWDVLGQSILLGSYGVMIAGVWAVLPSRFLETGAARVSVDRLLVPQLGGWGGILRQVWEQVIARTIARLLAPLGARTRLVALVLIDNTSFWIVLAILVLILVIGRNLDRPTVVAGTLVRILPELMAAALLGAWQVTTMTRRLCLQAYLSRRAALLVAVVTGPLLILCAGAVLFTWRPLVTNGPGVESTPMQYFSAVYPQATSVMLPIGAVMSVDDYCQRLMAHHVAIDPAFMRAQRLAQWRIAAHSADLQVPEPVLRPNLGLGPKPSRPLRGSHMMAQDPLLAQYWERMNQEQELRDAMASIARELTLLGSAAAGTCFLLVLALVMPGGRPPVLAVGPPLLPATSQLRLLTWGQLNGGALLLGSLALISWHSDPVPVSAEQPLPPVPVPLFDHILIWTTGHAVPAVAIIALTTVVAIAWLRQSIRSLPLR